MISGRIIWSAFFVAICLPAVSAAQSSAIPGGDVSVGATFVRDSVPSNLIGWSVSASRRTADHLSIVGELGRHSGDETVTLLTFPAITSRYRYVESAVAGGVRMSIGSGSQPLPFAQILLGLNRRETISNASTTRNSLAVDTTLGLDVRLAGRLAARFQGGWRYLMTDTRYRNEIRATVGLTFLFGG